jgi:tetratricopeptide (TPR) repeat protein
LRYAPVLAEALLENARTRVLAEPARAVPLYTEAVWTAQANRDDRVAAAAAVGLVEAYGLTNQPKDWKTWEDYASAALKRIGGDGELEAQLWSALGQCTREQGRYSESLEAHEKATRLLEQRYGSRDVRTLEEERSALAAINNIGREAEARTRKLPLLARTEEVLGPHHPLLARMLVSVGFSDTALGYFADAQKVLGRAATILRDLGDTESRRWSSWYVVASDLALREGRYVEAQGLARRGLLMHEKLGMRTNTAALSLIGDLHLTEARLGHPDAAIAALVEELRRAEGTMGDNNPALESLFISLADSYEVAGRRADALAVRERYVALMRARNPPHSGQVAAAVLELERSLAWARPEEVLRTYDTDNQELLATTGPQSVITLRVRMVRGEALLARGDATAASAELEAAVRVADAGGYDPNVRARLRGELAQARFAMDQRSPAVAAIVAEAERDFARSEHADAIGRAALARWARAHVGAGAAAAR